MAEQDSTADSPECLASHTPLACRYFNDFESALFGASFLDPVNGWRKYANQATFIDWFLVQEIIKNSKHTYHGTSFTNKVSSLYALPV